jgi:hypothetical protein
VVDPRFMVSALIGAFCAAIIFAAIATVRHVSNRAGPAIARTDKATVPVPDLRTKQLSGI